MKPGGMVDLVVFDFDGTICDSADVKTEAFHRLYLDEHGPAFAAVVRDHHIAHAGVSRYDKIRYVEQELLDRPGSDAAVEAVAEKFSSLVFEQVVAAPLLPGVTEFLGGHSAPPVLCLASATPGDELRAIVAAKGLDRYFAAVEGSPTTKSAILAGYVTRFGARPERAVMVGDQHSDRAAAADAGTLFVGVRPPGGDRLFPPSVPVIADFADLWVAVAAVAG